MNLYFCSLSGILQFWLRVFQEIRENMGVSLCGCWMFACVIPQWIYFPHTPFFLFSRVEFLMAASPSCVWLTLPSSRLSWWRSVTPSSPIAEYALSLQHTLHDMFFNAADHMLMSTNRVSELPSERAALRCRVHCRGRPVEEDPQYPLSFLYLRTTEGGTDLVSSSCLS